MPIIIIGNAYIIQITINVSFYRLILLFLLSEEITLLKTKEGVHMKTVKIPVSQATPGMIVADSVYTFNNQLIISEGTTLTDKVITRLNFYSIQQILIKLEDKKTEPLVVTATYKPYLAHVMNTPEFQNFQQTTLHTANIIRNTLDGIAKSNSVIDTASMFDDIRDLVTISRNGLHVFDMLHCMRSYDDSIYLHSVNVAILCYTFGTWLKYSRDDLEALTLSGLFHDIGKIMIPDDILKKPSKLTPDEYSTVMTHAVRGYNILKTYDINPRIKLSAMMHHERLDGSGYPMGLKGSQIDTFAKIVMIADV